MAKVQIIQRPQNLEDAKDGATDLRPLLQQIGALLTARTQAAFRQQGRGGNRWAPRAVPNVAGIVSDLAAGKNPPARRFQPRPALVDTGRLRGSINWQLNGGDEVEVGTAVPYAAQHQEGGTSTLLVTQAVKDGLANLLRQKPQLEADLAFLFNEDRLDVDLPARPFLLITAKDERDINELVRQHMLGGR